MAMRGHAEQAARMDVSSLRSWMARHPVTAMHNAMVNPTGLGIAVFEIPQTNTLVIMSGLVVLAGVIIAIATRGRLGLKRP